MAVPAMTWARRPCYFIAMPDSQPMLDYQRLNGRRPRSIWRPFLAAAAMLAFPAGILTGLAALDGITNPHSDFIAGPWLCMAAICWGVVSWWVILKRRDR